LPLLLALLLVGLGLLFRLALLFALLFVLCVAKSSGSEKHYQQKLSRFAQSGNFLGDGIRRLPRFEGTAGGIGR
jgi:hypothetical protein